MAIVIAAFPGMGKTFTTLMYNKENCLKVHDSDSHDFHFRKNENGEKEVIPEWPSNYAKHIRSLMTHDEIDIVFISTHQEIRDELAKRGIPVIVVHPAPSTNKESYCKRFIDRKTGINGADFANMICSKWDEFMKSLRKKHNNELMVPVYSAYMDLKEVLLRSMHAYKNKYSYVINQIYFLRNSKFNTDSIDTYHWMVKNIGMVLDKID